MAMSVRALVGFGRPNHSEAPVWRTRVATVRVERLVSEPQSEPTAGSTVSESSQRRLRKRRKVIAKETEREIFVVLPASCGSRF